MKKILLAALGLVAGCGGGRAGDNGGMGERGLGFHSFAKRPPMGWNSWDCWGAGVDEGQVLANAKILSGLRGHGWEYVVVDIQWYEPGARTLEYRAGARVELDGYGRLMPAVNRFPSSAGGKGFKALADEVHGMGLKFGIHLLRGIPRQAVAENLPVWGTAGAGGTVVRAGDIANVKSVCAWNTDMYGVDMSKPGGQAYYDSVFALAAEWGVDFVKVDDLSRPYMDNVAEIEGIRRAIDKTGRVMVLSLSPGETPIASAEHVVGHANMWRISDDFWDEWKELKAQFARTAKWAAHAGEGHWPDADMIPFGRVRAWKEKGNGGWTRFTRAEERTLMNLWCISRSPLMFGGDLPGTDGETIGLLTNDEVIEVNQMGGRPREFSRVGDLIVWVSEAAGGGKYVGLFNARDGGEGVEVGVGLSELGVRPEARVRDLWAGREVEVAGGRVAAVLRPHESGIYLVK